MKASQRLKNVQIIHEMIYNPISWHFFISVIPVIFISIFPSEYLLAAILASCSLINFSQRSAGGPSVKIHYQNTSDEEENCPKRAQKSPKWVFFHPCELDQTGKHDLCKHEKDDNVPELMVVSFKKFFESPAVRVSS